LPSPLFRLDDEYLIKPLIFCPIKVNAKFSLLFRISCAAPSLSSLTASASPSPLRSPLSAQLDMPTNVLNAASHQGSKRTASEPDQEILQDDLASPPLLHRSPSCPVVSLPNNLDFLVEHDILPFSSSPRRPSMGSVRSADLIDFRGTAKAERRYSSKRKSEPS